MRCADSMTERTHWHSPTAHLLEFPGGISTRITIKSSHREDRSFRTMATFPVLLQTIEQRFKMPSESTIGVASLRLPDIWPEHSKRTDNSVMLSLPLIRRSMRIS